MTDTEIERLIELLVKCQLSSYEIAKNTGITNQSIINYRNRKTKPTKANAQLLEYFLSDYFAEKSSKNSENTITGNNNVIGNNSTIDNRQYYSDSPDVLRAQIDLLDERIKEKDAQIKEKDAQIKEKDAQIKELHGIIKQLSQK